MDEHEFIDFFYSVVVKRKMIAIPTAIFIGIFILAIVVCGVHLKS